MTRNITAAGLGLAVALARLAAAQAAEEFLFTVSVESERPVPAEAVSIAPMIDAAEGAYSVAMKIASPKDFDLALAQGKKLAAKGLRATCTFFHVPGADAVARELAALGHEICARSASDCDGRGVHSALPFLPLGRLQHEMLGQQRWLEHAAGVPVQSFMVMCEGAAGFLPEYLACHSGFLSYFLSERRAVDFLVEDFTREKLGLGHDRGGAKGGPGPAEGRWKGVVVKGHHLGHGSDADIPHSVTGLFHGQVRDEGVNTREGRNIDYPPAEEGRLRLPLGDIHSYLYLRKHLRIAEVRAIADGCSEITLALDAETNPRFVRVPVTVLIKAPGIGMKAAECNGRPAAFKNRDWGAFVSVPPESFTGGPILRFESAVDLTAPAKKTAKLVIANPGKGSFRVTDIAAFGSIRPVTMALPTGGFDLAPGATQRFDTEVATHMPGTNGYAYGAKTVALRLAWEQDGRSVSALKALPVRVIPLLSADVVPFEAVVAKPGGRNFFSVRLSRRATHPGSGVLKSAAGFPAFVIPAEGATAGRIEVETAGPFQAVKASLPFSFGKDETATVPLCVRNTNPTDEQPGEVRLRFFVDGAGEIAPLHPPIPIRVRKDLLLKPLNEQGLVLFLDYEQQDGEEPKPTAAADPKFRMCDQPRQKTDTPMGRAKADYTDGKFGKGLRELNGMWMYPKGEIDPDAGTLCFWMRRQFEKDLWEPVFQYMGGHMLAGAGGRFEDGQSMGCSYEPNGALRCYFTMGNGEPKTLVFPAPRKDGQYHHFAIVWNVARHVFRAYVDGRIAAEADPKDEAVPWLALPLHNENRLGGLFFSKYGRGVDKDQVAFFNRNLSEREIRAIMENGIALKAGRDNDNPDEHRPVDAAFAE